MKSLDNLWTIFLVVTLSLVFSSCATIKNDWKTTQHIDSIEAYEQFLSKHPGSEYQAKANKHVNELYAERDWKTAQDANSIDVYEKFLKLYPNSPHASDAKSRLEKLRVEVSWLDTRKADTVQAYEQFLSKHPGSEYQAKANKRVNELKTPPIIAAAKQNNLTVLKRLIKNGHDVNTKWNDAISLLHASNNDNLEMVKLLVKNGAEINFEDRYYSALFLADHANYINKQSKDESLIADFLIKYILKKHKYNIILTANDIRKIIIQYLKSSDVWQGNGGVQLFQIFPNDPEDGSIRVRCNASTWGDVAMYDVVTVNNYTPPEPKDKKIYTHIAFAGSDNVQFVLRPKPNGKWSVKVIRKK